MTKTEAKNKWNKFWERNRASEGYLFKKLAMKYAASVCRILMLFGLCFLILQPILNKISVSFMAETDLYNPMVINVPEHFTGENYRLAATFMEYGKALKNTFFISLTVAILQVMMCTLVAYGFARFNFPLKNLWFACVILTVVIPPQLISSPLHLHFRFFDVFGIIEAITGSTVNLRGSAVPYYLLSAGCMGLKNGLYIYMLRQFFRNQPVELEEAAYVDGCGMLRTFVNIMLPDAKPMLTSCLLFAFVWQWTDSFYSNMFIGGKTLLSIQLGRISGMLDHYLKTQLDMTGGASPAYTSCITATGTLMVIIPLLVLYLFAQKGFVESLSTTGIKG